MKKVFEAIGKATIHIGVICSAVIFMKIVPFWISSIVAVAALVGLIAMYYEKED